MKFLFFLVICVVLKQINSWCLRATLEESFEIREVDWAADNSIFVTASKGQKVVRIYNAKTFELLDVHNNSGVQPKSVKISKDSKWIGIGYSNSQLQILYNTPPYSTYYLVATGQGTIAEVDFSYDNQTIMSCGNDQGYVTYTIATKTGPVDNIKVLPNPGNAISCRFGPLGHIGYTDNNKRVRLHFPPDTQVFNTQYSDDIYQIDFKPTSSDFGTVSKDKFMRIPNSTLVFTDTTDLLTITVGKTSKYYAFGGKSKILFIYDQTSDKIMGYFNNFNSTINSVRLSADQNSLITGTVSGQIRVYTSKCDFNCESGEYNASGVCKVCSQTISYCVSCKTGASCDVCMTGFYVSGSVCAACYSSLNYCLECSDGSACVKCLDGYYLNAGKCVRCGMVGCLECNDSLICTKCFKNDFYLNTTTNACVQCASTLSNCIRCTDSLRCVDCQLGFYEDATTKNCVQCVGNCLICQSVNNCTQCKVGYWASGGSCIRCTDTGCISCNQTGVCYNCQQGMYLTSSNTCSSCTNPCSTCSITPTNCTGCLVGFYLDVSNYQCKSCIQNCKICNQSAKCLSCYPGYKLDSTTLVCKPCSLTYSNCTQCTQTLCLKCRQSFYLDIANSNTCKSCISVIPNCIQCLDSSICLSCITSYYLTVSTGVNSCAPCPNGCSQCVNSNNCTKCFSTYFLNSSLLCSPCQSNCFQCTTSSSCRSCLIGYYLDVTTCKPCESALSYCSTCVDINTCNSCQPGAYLDSTTKKCSLCTNNCLTCNKTDCYSCKVGFYIDTTLSPITCKRCSQQCQQCSSNLLCVSCIDGYYLDSVDNKCKSCGVLFPHCKLCNKTNCLECDQGTVLNASTLNTCQICTNFIGSCKTCYWDNTLATPAIKCSLCNYGFALINTNLSCSGCNSILGCIQCTTSSKCTKCEIGFYLKPDNTCGYCASKCLTCDNPTTCINCQQGYVNDTLDCVLCESKIGGCSKCVVNNMVASSYNCTYCQIGYLLDPIDNQCYLCHQQILGCYTCNDSSVCTACLDKYYLNTPINNSCLKCVTNIPGCQLCNSSSICIGCQDSYYLDIITHKCYFCSDNIPGCLHCLSNTQCSQCQAGYYLHTDNTCKYCESALQGCIYCNSPIFCIQCRAGFYLNNIDNKCHQCTQPGCDMCHQTDPNVCVSCNNKFYLSTTTCSDCVNLVPYCFQCNNTQCLQCEVGYYLADPLTCSQCSSSMSGCSRCNDGFTCLECMSSYFVNSSNLCQQCNKVLFGCQNCINDTVCISCAGNFFLNSTTDKCQSCTDLIGCMLCKNESTCVLCQQKYYMDGSECKLCSDQIKGCFSCVSNKVCVQCQSGYVLDTESYECKVNTIEAKQKVQGLKLVSYYVSAGMLKHILFAKGILFKSINSTLNITASGKTKLLVEDYTGKQIQLVILSYQFAKNGYSIIFYTDNPLGSQINLDSRKMTFRRLLVQQQINLQVLLKMDQNIYQQILPDLDYSGAVTLGYSLNNPQFTKSYMQNQGGEGYIVYEVIGIICIVLFLINYVVKFLCTLPHTRNRQTLLPHIIALKACCLIVYPSHFEYMSFCKGFMIVDIYWLNSVIAAELTDLSDKVAVPFGLFFDNMSFGGTYLLGLSGYILLMCLVQCWFYLSNQQKKKSQHSSQQSEISSQQQRRREKQFKIQKIESIIGVNYDNDESQSNEYVLMRRNLLQLLWNIFTFSVVYFSCLSVQGAFYNYQQIITINGVFYILGMLLFIYITIQTFYSFIRNFKLINKIRIYIKACLLSLAYLNPVYVTSVCVAFDIMLVILHFYLIKNKNQLSKFSTFSHILSTLSILFMIFISHSLVSLFLTVLSLLTCLALEIYIHVREYQIAHQTLNGSEFSPDQTSQKIQNQPEELNNTKNVWDLPLQNTKQRLPKHKKHYATMESFNKPDDQPNPFQSQEVEFPKLKNNFQQGNQLSRQNISKQRGRRNKLRKTQQVFKSNVIEIIPSRHEQNKKTIFDFDEPQQISP